MSAGTWDDCPVCGAKLCYSERTVFQTHIGPALRMDGSIIDEWVGEKKRTKNWFCVADGCMYEREEAA